MRTVSGLLGTIVMFGLGCAHTPNQPGARADLKNDAQKTLDRMEAKDPGLRKIIDDSVGYIVFPSVGSGGFIVGGGAGVGVLFENHKPAGFVELRHTSVGALVGGQRYSELVVIHTREALESLRSGRHDFGVGTSATILRTGKAAAATFENGVAVFIDPVHGAMVSASVTSQRIRLTL